MKEVYILLNLIYDFTVSLFFRMWFVFLFFLFVNDACVLGRSICHVRVYNIFAK